MNTFLLLGSVRFSGDRIIPCVHWLGVLGIQAHETGRYGAVHFVIRLGGLGLIGYVI